MDEENKNVTADEEVKQEEVTETIETVEETVAEEEVKEEVAEEPAEKTEKESEKDKTIASLNEEIARLTGELETANTSTSSKENELSTVNTTVEAQKATIADYETLLNGIITERLAGISDNIKALMPEKGTIAEKLDWLNKAEQSGILKVAENPNVEIGKPLNPNNHQQTDTSKLSAGTILSLAYGNTPVKKK